MVEREAHAAEVLAARMEDGSIAAAPVWSDVTTFDPLPWRGVVHCVTSGDPCQPNSLAGKRQGADDDRWLLDHIIRIVAGVRPARFFRENVCGNVDGQIGHLVPALEKLGYRVAVGIFSAREAGASHIRERLFLMADRCGEGHEESEFAGEPGGTERGFEARPAAHELCGALLADAGGKVVDAKRSRREAAGSGSSLNAGEEPKPRIGDLGNPKRGGDRGFAADEGRRSLGGIALVGPGREFEQVPPLPIFAPGPSDPRWRQIIADAPHLEPAVRRVDARMVDRLDRLRECGNGVSSLAAALAWLSLDARLAQE